MCENMQLWGVVVTGVYPPQCVTVLDSKARAEAIVQHLAVNVGPEVEAQPVESFYPRGMTEPDSAWLRAMESFKA